MTFDKTQGDMEGKRRATWWTAEFSFLPERS